MPKRRCEPMSLHSQCRARQCEHTSDTTRHQATPSDTKPHCELLLLAHATSTPTVCVRAKKQGSKLHTEVAPNKSNKSANRFNRNGAFQKSIHIEATTVNAQWHFVGIQFESPFSWECTPPNPDPGLVAPDKIHAHSHNATQTNSNQLVSARSGTVLKGLGGQ